MQEPRRRRSGWRACGPARHGEKTLLQAIGDYEREMMAYGFAD
jgi:hypothetical protein